MATLAEKRDRLERLRKLRDSGLRSTTVDGVTTTFSSAEELSQAIKRLEQELGTRPRRKRHYNVFLGHR